MGIYGLNWCDQLFLIFWLHPWYMMLWLKILCFILPFGDLQAIISRAWHAGWWPLYRRWNGYELSSKHWMAWKHGQFISCWIFSQHLISIIAVMLYHSCWDYFSQLVLLWSILLVITFDSHFIWPDWSGMMKKVCYDQTYFSAGWLLIQAWSLICFFAEK